MLIHYVNYIITTSVNGSCLNNLGYILKNSQNYKYIYSVEMFASSRLHEKIRLRYILIYFQSKKNIYSA